MPENGTIDSCKLVQTVPAADHWIQGLVVSRALRIDPGGFHTRRRGGTWEQRLEAGEGGTEVLQEWRRAAFAPLSWGLEEWAVFFNQLLIFYCFLWWVTQMPLPGRTVIPAGGVIRPARLHPAQDYSLGTIPAHAHPMGAATWSAFQFLPPFALRCPPLPSTGIDPKPSP